MVPDPPNWLLTWLRRSWMSPAPGLSSRAADAEGGGVPRPPLPGGAGRGSDACCTCGCSAGRGLASGPIPRLWTATMSMSPLPRSFALDFLASVDMSLSASLPRGMK